MPSTKQQKYHARFNAAATKNADQDGAVASSPSGFSKSYPTKPPRGSYSTRKNEKNKGRTEVAEKVKANKYSDLQVSEN